MEQDFFFIIHSLHILFAPFFSFRHVKVLVDHTYINVESGEDQHISSLSKHSVNSKEIKTKRDKQIRELKLLLKINNYTFINLLL